MASDDASAIVRTVRIGARPETLFAFFTDPAKMVLWMGTHAIVDARPGGAYRVNVTGGNIARGEFVEVKPHRRIVFTWGWEEDPVVPPGSTMIEVDLTPDGDGTIVRFTHRDLPADRRASHTEGWEHYLARLALAGAGKDPGPDPWAKPAEEGNKVGLVKG